jgi:hypothetical protein
MIKPKQLLLAMALATVANAGLAQSRPGSAVRPFLGLGFTGGGDELASVDFSNGSSTSVHAGGLVDFKAGVDMLLPGPFSMQLSLGYHVDSADGSNGSYTFSRMPLELLGYVSPIDKFRLGLGVRSAIDSHISSSGVLAGNNASFTSTVGVILEGEYFPFRSLGIKVRAVSEKYKGKGINSGLTFDGTHGGVYGVYYFN